ncbi:MAG: Na/Pi cotransporter family protein [Firmicutes bacterium]|nr:Na/Pi cotransporter family protein [Bacillota bacterium]
MDIFDVLQMIGGLCLFLFGMETMGDGLTRTSGSKLESILSKLTSSVPKGVLLGAVVTAVIQSSSATTVMLVGFVNSGIMKLAQAIPVIMGANIGTTATAWLLSLTAIDGSSVFIKLLKPMSFSPILAAIAIVFMMFIKSEKKYNIGMILIGFAVLMYGMDIMSGAVEPLKEVPEFVSILTMFSNPILGVAAGAIVTAAIQSSSASVGILQALCLTGSISYGTAIPIIMGQNIGTCVTAILSSIGANKGAKRVAAVHLSFNLIGTIVFLIVFYVANAVIGFSFMNEAVEPHNIAVIHSIFNVCATALLLPFYKQLEKLAIILVKDSPEPEKKVQDGTLTLLDERFLETPSVAVMECKTVAAKMANLSKDSIVAAMNLISKYDEDKFNYVNLLESKIDRYEDALSEYIIKLERQDLSIDENNTLNAILHNVGDLERISDHAKNIAETALELNTKGLAFSADAKHEIDVYMSAVEEIVTIAVDSFIEKDVELATSVEPLEEVIDEIHARVKDGHIERLRKGECTIELGFILSDLGTNLERVADHCSNLAICTIETSHDGFDMHRYSRRLKKYDMENFEEKERAFAAKYSIN